MTADARRSDTRVIAVAAPIGGGKSALVAALHARMAGSVVLQFDDYETATRKTPDALAEWLAAGGDFDLLEAPGLADELRRLMATDASFVIFEMPLGRAWRATADLIDVLAWIDLPLDIALARRVMEIAQQMASSDPKQTPQQLEWLRSYLAHYVNTVHDVLQLQAKTIWPGADVTVDGLGATAVQVDQVIQAIQKLAVAESGAA